MRINVGRDIRNAKTAANGVELAESAMALLGCQTEADVYRILGDFVALMAPDSAVMVNELTPDYRFLITRYIAAADDSPLLRAMSRAGISVGGRPLPVSPPRLKEVATGKMATVSRGLAELVSSGLEGTDGQGSHETPDHELHVFGIAAGGEVCGGVYVLTAAGTEGLPVQIIESLARHCSPALTRIRMDHQLAQQAKRARSEEALEKSRLLRTSRIEGQEGTVILSIDSDYRYLHFNPEYARLMESMYGTHPRVGMSVLDCIGSDEDRSVAKANYDRALNGEYHSYVRKYGDAEPIYYETWFDPIMSDGEVIGATILARDVTERKRAEAYVEMGRDILQILNEPSDPEAAIDRVIETLKTRTGLDSVGIRLRDGDEFPYHADEGIPADTLLRDDTVVVCAAEGSAHRDEFGQTKFECECGLFFATGGKTAVPRLTPGGSFWTNDSSPVVDVFSGADPRIAARRPCVLQGYSSIAIVPIRGLRGIVGLIHLGDRRAGRFTPDTIRLLEGVASHIGAALLREKAAVALSASEEKFRSVVEHTNDGIAVVQNDRVCYGNPALARLTGYSVDEFAEADMFGSPTPNDEGAAIFGPQSAHTTDAAQQVRLQRKDGTQYSAEVSVSQITYRGAPAKMVLVRNVTERKEAEERLLRYQARLQAIAAELVVSREHERARLGVELHDGLGQELAAAKLMAQVLAEEPLDDASRALARKLVNLLGESIREVRQMTSALAPTVLFELGLGASLLWLRDRYNQLYGLECAVRTSKDVKHLRGETTMFLFRVAREALNNVVRHSGTLRATVSVGRSGGFYTVCVSDRGVGFDSSLVDDPGEFGGFGLFSIREECRAMGGSVQISSRIGQGTRVRVRVPDTSDAGWS